MMFPLLPATALGAAFAAASPLHSTPSSPTVWLKNGTVSGYHQQTYNQDYFLGIPYAQPPVGDLRFRVPQSLNKTRHNTLHATHYAPSCVGYGGDDIGYPVSEDCLYLNVIRPSGYEHQDLPVGVWIHGGGLVMGGTQDERYNLSFIIDNGVKIGKPFIGVSIGYRLSTWGFLASDEVVGSGNTNLGLRDQRLALHWIQENIKAFGGDPRKVTIWGESAGAGSVGWHLTAYNGRDDKLFRAGIMESGNPVNYNSYRDMSTYQPQYDALVAAVGCTSAIDNLQCLREVPFNKLNQVINETYSNIFSPIVDGDFIQRYASIQLAEGDFVKVPIIDGANSDEGTAFGARGINTDAEFVAVATNSSTSAWIGPQFGSELAEAYPNVCNDWIPDSSELACNVTYPASYGTEWRRSAAYYGDVVMIANRRGACQTWAANGIPAYSYRFNTIPAGINWETGVTHFQEVAFVFDNTQGLGYNAAHGTINPFTDKPQSYYELARLMSRSWASFIYDTNPNFRGKNKGSPNWPAYSIDKPQNIVWDANVTSLAFIEPDTFRKQGIQWILDHALAYRR